MEILTPRQVAMLNTELRLLRREMRERNVRVISCFNAGLTNDEVFYNTRLFEIKTRLRSR